MKKKLYVGNLPYNTTDEGLTEIFAAHGAVERAHIVYDRDTGRSRGFGFVLMSNADEADAAIDMMNGADVGGRTLKVSEARERERERPPEAARGGFFQRPVNTRDEQPGGYHKRTRYDDRRGRY